VRYANLHRNIFIPIIDVIYVTFEWSCMH
jgi:hypothetical protein